MLNLSIPEQVKPLRDQVLTFIEERIYPREAELHAMERSERIAAMRGLMQEAKDEGSSSDEEEKKSDDSGDVKSRALRKGKARA